MHVFQLSRLFHRQWQTNPAEAIASLIIDAYTRRAVLSAGNADVLPTIVGVAYLRFMKNVKTDACALYTHHRHFCACKAKNSLFTSHCSVEAKLVMLWNAILACIKHWSAECEFLLLCANVVLVVIRTTFLLFTKNLTFTHWTLTFTRTIFTTPRKTDILWNDGVANVCSL